MECSDYEAASENFYKALTIYRPIRDVLGEANCIRSLAAIKLRRGDYETARSLYDDASELYLQIDDDQSHGQCIRAILAIESVS